MKVIPNESYFAWVEEEIAQGRPVQFRLKGVSMFPLMRNGKDEVVLYPCKGEELKPMDVVLFRYRGKHLLHRIIRREGDCLYIQGDGSYVAKESCNVADVVGKMHAVIRPGGRRVSVESRSWRIQSLLWQKTGIFRPFLLRVLRVLFG